MEMIFTILYNFANVALILNFVLVSILIIKRKIDSKYRFLFIYLLSMLIFGSLLEIKRILGLNNWNFIESFCLIQSFAHFIFLSLFILNEEIKKMKKRLLFGSSIFMFFLFAFSIYLIMLKNISGLEFLRFIWPITPIGGIVLVYSWILVFVQSRNLGKSN